MLCIIIFTRESVKDGKLRINFVTRNTRRVNFCVMQQDYSK